VIVLLIFSLIIRFSAAQPEFISVRFDTACWKQSSCGVLFNVHDKIKGPVYLYVHHKEYFVNHRNVVRSVSRKQLAGEKIGSEELNRCTKFKLNKDAAKTTSFGGSSLSAEEQLSPCGIFPTLIPMDTFALTKKSSSSDPASLTADAADTSIAIKTDDGLTWDGLKGSRYKNQEGGSTTQWADIENGKYPTFSHAQIH
jgi:hypothetical protein